MTAPGSQKQEDDGDGGDSAAGDGECPVEPVPRASAEVVLSLDACSGDSRGVDSSRRMEREYAEDEGGDDVGFASVQPG